MTHLFAAPSFLFLQLASDACRFIMPLPKSSVLMHGISVRNYEIGGTYFLYFVSIVVVTKRVHLPGPLRFLK